MLDCRDRLLTLASAVTLLTHSDPHTSPPLTLKQLLYLTQEEGYLGDSSSGEELPPPLANITEELWKRLHHLPLTTKYFTAVVESLHTSPSFWERAVKQEVESVDDLPWRDSGKPITLNDFVFLNLISRDKVVLMLQQETASLVNGITVPVLDDVCGSKGKPLLFLHDERSAISQANLWQLESELKRVYQVHQCFSQSSGPPSFLCQFLFDVVEGM